MSKTTVANKCCQVCFDEKPAVLRKKEQFLTCPGCNQDFCLECQKTYSEAKCMNCKMEWKLSFVREHLGQPFITKVVKPAIIAEIMKEQKEKLPTIQPFVEWERQVREEKKKARFGIRPNIPPRPDPANIRKNEVFPCPKSECRGFVENGVCGTCKSAVCVRCHELESSNVIEGHHQCRPEDMMSVAAIHRESKQCPRCTTNIMRSAGCNHMFCTNCRTHFDWVSGKVLSNSSNGHYINLQRFTNEATTRTVTDISGEIVPGDGTHSFSLYRNKVDVDKMKELGVPDYILRVLYDDSAAIRHIKRIRFNEDKMNADMERQFEELQIKYLLNDITEEQWQRHVYRIHQEHKKSILYANVFNIYLRAIDNYQISLSGPNWKKALPATESDIQNMIRLCNESLESIHEEYAGSVCPHIRNIQDDAELPALVL